MQVQCDNMKMAEFMPKVIFVLFCFVSSAAKLISNSP